MRQSSSNLVPSVQEVEPQQAPIAEDEVKWLLSSSSEWSSNITPESSPQHLSWSTLDGNLRK